MDPGDSRQESFFDHLSDSEKRLGARRHSVLDALVVGAIAVIIVGGFTLGIMRLRTPAGLDQAKRPDTAAPARDDKAMSRPTPGRAQAGKDERPSIDASKPGRSTIRDPKVGVEINTLSERERDAKLEQFRKEGLLTDREVEALKKQKPAR